jgi:DNA-binding NarL/FixJ family response regulator
MNRTGYNVLVAEDKAIIALNLEIVLSLHNYNVVGIVKSGLELIRESKYKNPDIIVSDINLKGILNGIDAVKIIKQLKDIPVIFLTGDSDNSTYQKALTASPSAVMLKPFSERELIKSINKITYNIRMNKKMNICYSLFLIFLTIALIIL